MVVLVVVMVVMVVHVISMLVLAWVADVYHGVCANNGAYLGGQAGQVEDDDVDSIDKWYIAYVNTMAIGMMLVVCGDQGCGFDDVFFVWGDDYN